MKLHEPKVEMFVNFTTYDIFQFSSGFGAWRAFDAHLILKEGGEKNVF